MADLLAYAWACDLNRVATFMFTSPGNFTVFSELGQTQGFHVLAHDANEQAQVHDGVVFAMQRCAYFQEKLKLVPQLGA